MPAGDTPGVFDPAPGDLRTEAEAAWCAVTSSIAATAHVRVSRDGGRTYPARTIRPLPASLPGYAPCAVPVYDAGPARGRLLALDLDVSRGDAAGQAAGLGQLLERIGARHVADAAPSGGRHLYVLFSSPLPWLELRDLARAISLRFPAVDPAPMCSPGGQISPPGSRHKSGGWRVLSMPLDEARAAVEHPNGPGVWAALLAEFAAELREADRRGTVDNVKGLQEAEAELDDAGVPWVPRLGGRAPLGAEHDQIARTGRPVAGTVPRPGWPCWAPRRPVAGSWPTSGQRSPPARGKASPACTPRRPNWAGYGSWDYPAGSSRQRLLSRISTASWPAGRAHRRRSRGPVSRTTVITRGSHSAAHVLGQQVSDQRERCLPLTLTIHTGSWLPLTARLALRMTGFCGCGHNVFPAGGPLPRGSTGPG